MGISIAQATLQSLVDQHNGISYKEALEEIRAYIADVQKTSHNTGSPKLPTLVEVKAHVQGKMQVAIYECIGSHVIEWVYDYICRQLRAGA